MQYLHGEYVGVDSSQSLDLGKIIKPPALTIPCLLPGSTWRVSYPPSRQFGPAVARPLLGREHMALQGYDMHEARPSPIIFFCMSIWQPVNQAD